MCLHQPDELHIMAFLDRLSDLHRLREPRILTTPPRPFVTSPTSSEDDYLTQRASPNQQVVLSIELGYSLHCGNDYG